jgi:excisionase family DNA binding protein
MVCGKPERAMSVAEVADLLDVTVETVMAWIESGRLRAVKAATSDDRRVRYADLERLIRADEVARGS